MLMCPQRRKERGGREGTGSWQRETWDRDMGISQNVGEGEYLEKGEKEKRAERRSYWLHWEEKFFLRKRSSSCFPICHSGWGLCCIHIVSQFFLNNKLQHKLFLCFESLLSVLPILFLIDFWCLTIKHFSRQIIPVIWL